MTVDRNAILTELQALCDERARLATRARILLDYEGAASSKYRQVYAAECVVQDKIQRLHEALGINTGA